MPEAPLPQVSPEDLARRLDAGERLQVLDVRAPERVASSRVAFGPGLDFKNLKASEMYALPSVDSLGLDPRAPVAVICGHGNSSQRAARFLVERGYDAYSVTGGMAAWETVSVTRRIPGTTALEHVIQLDRVGKGALSYVLASDGDAVVVDPSRHVEQYESIFSDLGVTPRAVVDTHAHADYLSGAPALATHWKIPYFLHPADARSPYDGTPARLDTRPIEDGDVIAFGRTTLRVEHTPGHTLGSVTLVADEALSLTGDFIFVRSVGRPDLGGQGAAWVAHLWRSLEDARRRWPGDRVVLPTHYASEEERGVDRAVAARFDVISATNPALAIHDADTFTRWATQTKPPPENYRTIKLANLGLLELSAADAEIVETGPNQCAV